MPLAKGQTVMIYEDPLTEGEEEGFATLLDCRNANQGVYDGRQVEFWDVQFMDERGETYVRSILTPASMSAGCPTQ